MPDLVSLQDYKFYKGVSGNSSDTKLSLLVPYVNNLVREFCGRQFILTNSTITEYHDGRTVSKVYVNEPNIVSVTSVKASADAGVTQTTLVENTDYYVDLESNSIVSAYTSFVSASSPPIRTLEVVYITENVVPEDLKIAVIELIDYYNKEDFKPQKATAGVTIDTSGGANIEPRSIPRYILDILRVHRI